MKHGVLVLGCLLLVACAGRRAPAVTPTPFNTVIRATHFQCKMGETKGMFLDCLYIEEKPASMDYKRIQVFRVDE